MHCCCPSRRSSAAPVRRPDDMPGHVKSSLLGASLTVPISRGRLALGTWQGVYLVEARDAASARRVVVTLQGQRKAPKGAAAAAAGSTQR